MLGRRDARLKRVLSDSALQVKVQLKGCVVLKKKIGG